MICKHILLIIFLNDFKFIFCTHLNGFKQILLFNTNYSIQHYSFICTKINGSKYCHLSQTIQVEISHLFIHLNDQTALFLTIQHKSFVCTQFKCQIVLFDP